MFAVLKEACGAALDPEMAASRNEADLVEEEVEESQLAALDRQIAEAKTEVERQYIQYHRDMMAETYKPSFRQQFVL